MKRLRAQASLCNALVSIIVIIVVVVVVVVSKTIIIIIIIIATQKATTTTTTTDGGGGVPAPLSADARREAPIAAPSKAAPLYYNCTLAKGTHLEHSGDVIVVGNVEKDASVTTEDGDIVVFGSLRGEAIVRTNNERSQSLRGGMGKIFALDMRPEVLEIDHTQMAPPEHLLDTGVEVKDRRVVTGIPMVAEKSSSTGEITFSKFYGKRAGERTVAADDMERCIFNRRKRTVYPRNSSNAVNARQW